MYILCVFIISVLTGNGASIPYTISNWIILYDGPFRSFTDPNTMVCILLCVISMCVYLVYSVCVCARARVRANNVTCTMIIG